MSSRIHIYLAEIPSRFVVVSLVYLWLITTCIMFLSDGSSSTKWVVKTLRRRGLLKQQSNNSASLADQPRVLEVFMYVY